ncbi:hypothetical protein IDJ77_19655 [Mucilaginibacter sp. ZT4R22]|uniref:Lipoprotein SmpA/OmlA domain-containing protein n=1 Tax=Mucilaginibacter pankratovii TaxID=2772110 RepID=A0ABR7WUP6_9SPHI|nr:hypothetical protein [Mucilaginibacter pankratovii]MBD1366039.1 hypothetical protein [Mucilaginibacter pankratovii]
MKKTLIIIITVLASLLNAKSQTLFTPADLMRFHQVPDSTINETLVGKGYRMTSAQEESGGKIYTWEFQTRSVDEVADFYLLKATSPKNKSLRYWIMNIFFYKEFMDNLVKEGYKFTGIGIIEKESYFVFKNGDKQLLVSVKKITGKNDDYFEILIN